MDWLMRSKLKSVGNAQAESSGSASSNWDPEARIAIVQRKLEGANPLSILKDELSISQVASNRNLLEKYQALADGEDGSLRQGFNVLGLTPDEQVTCLTEMALDKAMLAMMYLGFDPWV